ncbi:ABC transporter permease [Vagococcus sp. BWB3-3]|uniref:ABC transporter permease n=1 Tax=Vagococcus allomyrinae TaxID=2794353 RepID=A0A940PFB6_9ENTE|nr:ABC transporter permease [Vagococcus allomyrinae]
MKKAYLTTEHDIKSKLPLTATIVANLQEQAKFLEKNPDKPIPLIDLATYKKISQLDYVKDYDFSEYDVIDSKKLQSAKSIADEEIDESDWINEFLLKGTSSSKGFDLISEKIAIQDGRFFESSEAESNKKVIVISDVIATKNNLTIDDSLTLDQNFDDFENNVVINETYKIIGIFNVTNKIDTPKTDAQFEELVNISRTANTMYLSNANILEFRKKVYTQLNEVANLDEQLKLPKESYDAFYVLKDANDLESFRQEAESILNSNLYSILISTDQFDKINSNLISMSQLADTIIGMTVIATIAIVGLVITLSIRERKHEFGIYLSFGERKRNIVFQVLIETFTILLLAVTLSGGVGKILANELSNSFVRENTSTEWGLEQEIDVQQFNNIGNSVSDIDHVEQSFAITFSLSDSLQMISFIFILVLISIIFPITYLLSFNPKKLLM